MAADCSQTGSPMLPPGLATAIPPFVKLLRSVFYWLLTCASRRSGGGRDVAVGSQ